MLAASSADGRQCLLVEPSGVERGRWPRAKRRVRERPVRDRGCGCVTAQLDGHAVLEQRHHRSNSADEGRAELAHDVGRSHGAQESHQHLGFAYRPAQPNGPGSWRHCLTALAPVWQPMRDRQPAQQHQLHERREQQRQERQLALADHDHRHGRHRRGGRAGTRALRRRAGAAEPGARCRATAVLFGSADQHHEGQHAALFGFQFERHRGYPVEEDQPRRGQRNRLHRLAAGRYRARQCQARPRRHGHARSDR